MYYPDTEAGQQEAQRTADLLQEKHDKKPPSKKVNYSKYGVASPFHLQWNTLQMNWQCSSYEDFTTTRNSLTSTFCVLRNRKMLDKLGNLCVNKRRKPSCEKPEDIGLLIDEIQTVINSMDILVPVQIDMLSKGTPSDNAMICVPHMEDLEEMKRNNGYIGPSEPIRPVPTDRQIQKKGDNTSRSIENCKVVTAKETGDSSGLSTEQNVSNVRWHCIRETAGFLVSGGFSLTCGHGRGVGFITLPALFVIVQQGHSVVLVRNISSLQYRFAKLSIFKSAIKLY